MNQLSIGEVSRKSGVAVSAIRYYEDCGLLPPADRQANSRRCYGNETLEMLQFIFACRKNAMGLESIRDLQHKLAGTPSQCDEASAILAATIKELSARVAELQAARRHLSKVVSACCAENCGQSDVACNIQSNMKAVNLA